MDTPLSAIEIRVLGALIEKQITVPESYPLSLNSTVTACNQKSNRYPVVNYSEDSVTAALDSLRRRQLVRQILEGSGRVSKYAHVFNQALKLDRAEVAVLCVLMLRGPQTTGEIRGRTGRLYEFKDLAEVEQTLASLEQREEGPLARRLPRQPGTKESRTAHLLSGEPPDESVAPTIEHEGRATPPTGGAADDEDRVQTIEDDIRDLRHELEALREQFMTFRKQFE